MRYFEFLEQITTPANPIGTTTPQLTGNTAVIQDPKMQAAQAAELAKQKQEKDEKRKELQQQIQDLQKQLADLNRT